MGGGQWSPLPCRFFTHNIVKDFQFKITKPSLALSGEYLWNSLSCALLYDVIQINKTAAEQLRESPPDTALAASHKSYKTNYHLCLFYE